MDNQAGPAAKPRRSARSTRQTRKTVTEETDGSGTDSKPAAPPKKRRRVTKAVMTGSGSGDGDAQAVVPKPSRKKAGKLATLLEMPLDILYEVFGQLDPSDILKLTRTSKGLRNLLLDKSSISVWRESMRSVPGLPECPPDLSIPAYVNLLYSPHCHLCSATTRTVEWRFRMRICKKCAKEDLDSLYGSMVWGGDGNSFETLAFYTLSETVPTRSDRKVAHMHSKTVFKAIAAQYDSLEGEEAKKQFIEERKALVKMIYKHAHACEVWEKDRSDSRHQDLSALREERLNAIKQKLAELDWGDEVKSIQRPDSLQDQKQVNKPQRLTEKIWSNIKDEIIAFMQEMRTKRLEREFKVVIKRRKAPAIEAIREFKTSKLGEGIFLPSPVDYCAFEPVQNILRQPVDTEVTRCSFDPVIPLLPGLISQWRDGLDRMMVHLTGIKYWNSSSPPYRQYRYDMFMDGYDSDDIFHPVLKKGPALEDSDALEKLKLASAVFKCNGCSARTGHLFRTHIAQQIMFYPQVLAHKCNCMNYEYWDLEAFMNYNYDTTPDPSITLGPNRTVARRKWDCTPISYDYAGRKVAEAVIAVAGLDPATATSQEMDDLDLRYICNACYEVEKRDLPDPTMIEEPEPEMFEDCSVTVGLFDWRGAVRHAMDKHKADNASFFTMNEEEMGQEAKEAEQKLRERTTLEWQCTHCMDTPNEKPPRSLQEIKDHLLAQHEIEEPALNEDYYRDFAAPDLHSYQRPLWVSYMIYSDPPGELQLLGPYEKSVRDENGNFVKNEDGTLKKELVDHDKYDYKCPSLANVDQFDPTQPIIISGVGVYDSDSDDMDTFPFF